MNNRPAQILMLLLVWAWLFSPVAAICGSGWQTQINYTAWSNTTDDKPDKPFNRTIYGLPVANCTKEGRLFTDTGVEIPSVFYGDETNGTGKNCIVSAMINQTSLTQSYWICANNPTATAPSYGGPTIYGGGGLGTAAGSITYPGAVNMTWGIDAYTGAAMSGISPKLGDVTFYRANAGGAAFNFGTAFPVGTLCNNTFITDIFTETTCWGTGGMYFRVYTYRNRNIIDAVLFGPSTPSGTPYSVYYYDGDAGTTTDGFSGSYAGFIGGCTYSATTSNTGTSYGGMVTTGNVTYHYYHTFIEDYVWSGASGNYYCNNFGGSGNGGVWRRDSWTSAPPASGYKIRYAIINDTTNTMTGADALVQSNKENATFWNPPKIVAIGAQQSANSAPTINVISTNPVIPIFGYSNTQAIVNATDDSGITSLALNWTWPNSTKSNIVNLTQNGDSWTSSNFSIDQFGVYSLNATACDASNLCVSSSSTFAVVMNASISAQNSTSGAINTPIEIGQNVTIRLNFTRDYNFTAILSANTNVTIFDTTASRTLLASNNVMTYISSLGLWQFNYTVPAGVNGTYKYNVRANVTNTTFGSYVDINGTFDVRDTTAPALGTPASGTYCSGYSNYKGAGDLLAVTIDATDNWAVNLTYSLCTYSRWDNLTVLANPTLVVGTSSTYSCQFSSTGPAGSSSMVMQFNDTVNNSASSSMSFTVVDSCPGGNLGPGPGSSSGSGPPPAQPSSDVLFEISPQLIGRYLAPGQCSPFQLNVKNTGISEFTPQLTSSLSYVTLNTSMNSAVKGGMTATYDGWVCVPADAAFGPQSGSISVKAGSKEFNAELRIEVMEKTILNQISHALDPLFAGDLYGFFQQEIGPLRMQEIILAIVAIVIVIWIWPKR